MSDVGWKFKRTTNLDGESGGNPAEFALNSSSIDGLVRDALQNAADEGPVDGDEPIEVVIHLQELTAGNGLGPFVDALDLDPDGDVIKESFADHLAQAAVDDRTLRRFLQRMYDEQRLVTATFEDRNANGLLGPEDASGKFSKLVLSELSTDKEDDPGSLGSYGLGKFVFSAWSGLSTVLFTSQLSEPDPRDANPRFIGRAFLPGHAPREDDAGFKFGGTGYFGRLGDNPDLVVDAEENLYQWGDGGGRPLSVWGSDADTLVDALSIPRDRDSPGTSVTVLGLSKPGATDQPEDLDGLGEDMAEAVSTWFWWAIAAGRLSVKVETPGETIDVAADYADIVRPFVRCYEQRDAASDQLVSPGDVAVKHPDIEVPPTSDGDETEDGTVDVYARLADPTADGPETKHMDKVAMIRGSGMVVKYYDLNGVVYGDRHFHGVHLAGRARSWDEDTVPAGDASIDDFLKAAEPPAHDNWEDTRHLTEQYGEGAQARVDDVQQTVRRAVKKLVQRSGGGGDHVAGKLAERLGIGTGSGPSPPSGPAAFAHDSRLTFDDTTERWELNADVEPRAEAHEEWDLEVRLVRLSSRGRQLGTVPMERVDCDEPTVTRSEEDDTYTFQVPADVDAVTLTGRSEPTEDRGRTKLDIAGEVVVGGEA